MKKITLVLFALAAFARPASAQTVSVEAPLYDGFWSALLGPNGFSSPSVASPTLTYAYNRACYLITQAELTRMISTNSVITGFGFDFYRPGSVPVTGQFTLYLENTGDVTYNKGTTFANIISGMQMSYNSTMTLPGSTSPSTANVTVPLSTNFTYTGGGIYVAYDWYTSAPTSTNYARYLATYDGVTSGANAMAPSAGPAPATLTTDVSRPSMRFVTTNTSNNEIGIVSMTAPGLVSKLVNPGYGISAIVENNSAVAKTNIAVTLNVGGANTYNNTQTIANLAAGTSTVVHFTPFVPTANGVNSMTVTVPADDYIYNDGVIWTQTVNCVDYGNNPPVAASSFSSGAYGFGAPRIIATPLSAPNSASITGIKFAPSNSGAGASICGVLLDAGGSIIAMTNTITLTNANFGTYQNLKFTPAEAINAGSTYYIGIAQLVGSTFPFGVADVLATTNLDLYYSVPITGGSIGSAQNHMGYMGLQAVLGFSNTTVEALASKTVVCKGDNEAITLTAAGGSTTFTWTPGNLTGASVVVTPTVVNQSGTINYNVTSTDGPSGCKSNVATITVSVSACTGLAANNTNGYDIKLFPNPAVNGKTSITGLSGTNHITVLNTLGQVVLTQQVSSDSTELDLSKFPSGNYLVKITNTESETRLVKVVNQN